MDTNLLALTTAAGTTAGLTIWLILYIKGRRSGILFRDLAIVSIVVGFICRVLFALFTPTFYAPDEKAHYHYVEYLAGHTSLPVQTTKTWDEKHEWEYYQPPAYYILLTPAFLVSNILFHDEAFNVKVLRVFSIVLWGLTLFFAFKFLERFGIHDEALRTFVVALVSLLPTYTFLSSVMNNDNLVIAAGSGISYLALGPGSLRKSIVIGMFIGLALLTKLNALVFVFLVLYVPAIGLFRQPSDRQALRYAVLSLTIALIMWAPWAWRNYFVYGSFIPEAVANIPEQWKSVYHAILSTLDKMQITFWSVSGIYNNICLFYPIIGKHVAYFACIGMIFGILHRRKHLTSFLRGQTSIAIAFALTIIMNWMLVMRFGLTYGQGQGRFLFPLLIPIAVLMGLGIRMYSITDTTRTAIHVTGFFVTYAVSFAFFSLAMFTRVH